MKVTFYFRRKTGFFSIEQLFRGLQDYFGNEIQPANCELPSSSIKPFNLIKNGLFARKHQADINHITGDIHYIAFFLRKARTILTIHDIESILKGRKIFAYLKKMIWLKIPVRYCKVITTVSMATRRELLKYVSVNPDKIRVIYNYIDPAFTVDSSDFNLNEPVILQVGTTVNKNLPNLMAALTGLNCKLIILGKLSEEQVQMLDKYKITYENYFNLDKQKVLELYRQSDLITLISFYEGFGLPIIEAQATGRPVITANCSSMPEVAGNGALFVDPYNVAEIKLAVQRIINDPVLRQQLISDGFQNIKRFQPEFIASQYVDLYKEVYNLNYSV